MPLTLLAALYGAAAGLLVPRAVYRLAVEPGEPWRADCPAGHPLTGPLRGWAGTGRCTDCAPTGHGGPLPLVAALRPVAAPGPSAPRPLGAAALGAAACAGLAVATGPRPELAAWLLLVPFALVLGYVDVAVHRLPDVLTLTLPPAAAVLLGLAAPLPGVAGSWTGALLGGVVLGGAFLLLFLIHPAGMGFGDVKLAVTAGVILGWYGWVVLFIGAFAGFLLGAVYGGALVLLRRAGRRTALPFGPFMMCGTFLGMLVGGLGAG
ncbi:prepilin peptidase [Streptomyces sp. PLAI1-29]|uniref:Prepilin peptidase n=1 Tax=Streptomyces zingiberis TaxID=2053010 RepID=A0ABX1BS10_9ACTN|nr:A24 family peptidase [Streptomyces zingiberis]NJQ00516.1 prepilin peptidase [Streptomyces zingiberis]